MALNKFDLIFRYEFPLFWTLFAIYNSNTKGVMELISLKKMFLMIMAISGCAISFWLLMVKNEPKQSNFHIDLPYAIGETGLVLESLDKYDGPYIEDRSEDYVWNVASAVLFNSSSECIESAYIEVYTDLQTYVFEISMLPAGKRVLVQDMNKTFLKDLNVIKCSGQSSNYNKSHEMVDVLEIENGSFKVVNNTGTDIASVSIFHKYWDEKRQMYYGGISYKTLIINLKAGDSVLLKSGYSYPSGSKIVFVA